MVDPRILVLKAKLKKEGSVEITLSGNCMDPLLIAGDHVLAKPVEQLKVGDLYLISLSNCELAVHRLVKKHEELNYTKGDRAKAFEILPDSLIEGTVQAVCIGGTTKWHRIKSGSLSCRISAILSRGMMRNTKNPSRWIRIREWLCKMLLLNKNRWSRKKWNK